MNKTLRSETVPWLLHLHAKTEIYIHINIEIEFNVDMHIDCVII